MKRKRFTYAAFATLMLLTACSQNEVLQDLDKGGLAPIGFTAIAGKQTKALPVDGGSFTGTNKLQLKAYSTETFDFGDFATAPTKWIDGTLVLQGNDWTTDYMYYWPSNEEYKLSFFSYYPDKNGANGDEKINFIDAQGYVNGGITYPNFEFTVATDVEDQKDLVAAVSIDQKRVVPSGQTKATPVNLSYKHLLSQVRFSAKSSNSNSHQIKITGIRVLGAKNCGKFTFNGKSDEVGAWSALTGNAAHIYRSTEFNTLIGGTKTPVPAQDNLNGALMLMPQSASNELMIEVTYSTYDGNTGQILLVKDIKKTALMEPLLRGKKYTYTLILPNDKSLQPITFTVDVAAWEDKAADDHNIKIESFPLTSNASTDANSLATLITNFAKETEPGGSLSIHSGSYTHKIEVTGNLTENVTIDLSAIDWIANIPTGSKIIIDANGINQWNAKKLQISGLDGNWSKAPDAMTLSSRGTITLTKQAEIVP